MTNETHGSTRTPMPASVRERAVPLLLLVLMVLATVPQPAAEAESYSYPVAKCHWGWKNGKDITVGVQKTGTSKGFPNNEFKDRVKDAIWGWNTRADGHWRLVFVDNVTKADILIDYTPTTNGSLGQSTKTSTGTCLGTSATGGRLTSANIRIDRRSDWFTRDNSWRSYWERLMCINSGGWKAWLSQPNLGPVGGSKGQATNDYLCSKRYDVGSVIMHELGHALGLPHPENAAQRQQAECNAITNNWESPNATMCEGARQQQTTKRTLHAWDVGALKNLHKVKLP